MRPITAVVFDFHSTLVSGGDPVRWLDAAWQSLRRPGSAATAFDVETFAGAVGFLDRIWEHARDVDPDSGRDLSPQRHREVFDATIERAPGVDRELADALYAAMPFRWEPYEDTIPVLTELRRHGTRVAILSNVGFDLRPILLRNGLDTLVDALVMSYEVGVVKPQPAIFRHALDLLKVAAEDALMVGDSWPDDGGAAALGVRTLILPRTTGPVHGLGAVLGVTGCIPADRA
jgi:HAD superfamily hydrolase (TIGR01509 family)